MSAGKKSSLVRRVFNKSKGELMPGTLIKCESGRYIAYYEHRTDIIANGENAKDAKNNLRDLYKMAMKHEENEGLVHEDDDTLELPAHFVKRSFKDRPYPL